MLDDGSVTYPLPPLEKVMKVDISNTAVKRLRMRELSGEEIEEHQLMMMLVHRYRSSLIAVILHLLAYYIIFIVSTAVCCVFWP